jgi:hypothetical protein
LQVGQALVGSSGVGHFQAFEHVGTTLTTKRVRFYAVLLGGRELTSHVLP